MDHASVLVGRHFPLLSRVSTLMHELQIDITKDKSMAAGILLWAAKHVVHMPYCP